MKHLFIATLLLIGHSAYAQSTFHTPKPEAIKLNDSAINKNLRSNSAPDSLPSVIRILERATRVDSTYYSAWSNLLGFQCQAGHFTAALATAKNIVRIFPNKADVLFFYGALQYKTGHKKEATTTFNNLLKLYNNYTQPTNHSDMQTAAINKGVVLILLDRKAEGTKLLKDLASKEKDKAVQHYITNYASMTKEQILDDMIPGKVK